MSSKLSEILKLFAWEQKPKSTVSQSAAQRSGLKPKVIKLNFRDISVIDEVSLSY